MSKEQRIKNYYQILGVSPTASKADIKASYRKLIRKWHPDVCKEPNANEMTIMLNEAYDVLMDDTERLKYNRLYMEVFANGREAIYDFSKNTVRYTSSADDNLAEAKRRAETEYARMTRESNFTETYGDIVWEKEVKGRERETSLISSIASFFEFIMKGNCDPHEKPDFIELNVLGLKMLPLFVVAFFLSKMSMGIFSIALVFVFLRITHKGREMHFIGLINSFIALMFAGIEFSLIILIIKIVIE